MASFQEQINQINKLREQYNLAERANYSNKLIIQKNEDPQKLSSITEGFRKSELAYRSADNSLNTAIKQLYSLDHRALTKELNGNIPITLLPVRIETRFVNPPVSAAPELWIRIYPDDIHANTHEPNLSQAEINAGETYWIKLAEIIKNVDAATVEEEKRNNWAGFKAIVTNAQRAIWVAKSTKPLNWLTKPLPAALQFPKYPEVKEFEWTRAPRTQALPDKFVVTIYNNDRAVFEQAGNTIPDTVFLSPDPFAGADAIKKIGNEIKFGEDIAWLQDFDKAISNGLAMKIRLQPIMFKTGSNIIERITVLGVLHSADTGTGANILGDLFDNHHYSKGLSFLPQNTATNNTEKDGSGYTKNEDSLKAGYYDSQPLAFAPGSDAELFATLLGINPDKLQDIDHVDLKEHFNGLAMNTSLYAATLSYYFNELMDPAVREADAQKIRNFFTNYVTARGPLASIRVGDQPYGMLVSSDLNRWSENFDKFYTGLTQVLRRLQSYWDQFTASKVVKVGSQGNSSDILLKILGLQPGSVSFRQRLGNLPDFSYSVPNININNLQVEVQNLNQRIVNFLATLGFNPQAAGNFYPLISNLIFYNRTNKISSEKLVLPDVKVSANDFLPVLPKSGFNYVEWIAKKSTLSALEAVNFDGDIPPRTLLCLLLRHAMLTEIKHASTRFYIRNKLPISIATFEKSLFNFDKNTPDLTSFELLRGEPKKIDDRLFANINGSIGDYILARPMDDTDGANINAMKKAMLSLSGLSTLALEQNLSDFIDLCSYRLDAWQTGLFTRRLQNNRKANPKGVYLGAYGLVENLRSETHIPLKPETIPEKLRPANGFAPFKLKENAGFTHVPSLNHATAMGLLLAGYKNHADRSKPEAFAINLSSERTRNALNILEGVRNGQAIEVLLGYQFERALHDATSNDPANNLNIYILPFRNKYEISNLSILQQGAAEAQETVNAYPVVNGLKIVNATPTDIGGIVNNIQHFALVMAIKDKLADTLDACNDLLMAESAYQLTQGNQDRTASVLNSTLLAEVPPEIQVVDTPRTSLLTYTHRISVHLSTDENTTPGNGWPGKASPRSKFEPGLNLWYAQIIGNPFNIVCNVMTIDETGNESTPDVISIAELNIQPIDLVYLIPEDLTGGATELESRIAFAYRQKRNVSAQLSVKIIFNPAGLSPSRVSLARIYPLLRNMKMVLGSMRAGTAKDFAPKSKTKNEAGKDLTGINFNDIHARVQAAHKTLSDEYAAFNNIEPNVILPKDEFNPATLKDFFDTLNAKPNEKPRYEMLELSDESIADIIAFQIMATTYGVQLAYPENFNQITQQSRQDLLQKTFNIWKIIKEKLNVAEDKLSLALAETNVGNKIKLYTEAAKAIMGDDFAPIQRFKYSNAADLDKTFGEEKQLLSYAKTVNNNSDLVNKESWLQSVSRVRPAIAKFEAMRIMCEAISGTEISLKVAQVPFRQKDSWLGFEFPLEYDGKPFNILDDTLALAVHGDAAFKTTEDQSVLIVDEWTEKIPVDEEITGIAYHYNQPNAAAPQAVIVAVEPTGSGKWDWDVLQGVLQNTLRRAKSRAVEPDHIMEHDVLRVLLPMTVASFDVNEANVSLDYLLLNDKFLKVASASNLSLYTKWIKN